MIFTDFKKGKTGHHYRHRKDRWVFWTPVYRLTQESLHLDQLNLLFCVQSLSTGTPVIYLKQTQRHIANKYAVRNWLEFTVFTKISPSASVIVVQLMYLLLIHSSKILSTVLQWNLSILRMCAGSSIVFEWRFDVNYVHWSI